MAYIGNDLAVAYPNYRNIDDISASFNGSTTSFALLVNGTAPVPQPLNSQQCLISVGGVLQRPDDTGSEGFRLSGGNIVFSSAPATGEDFFGVVLAGADYVNAGGNFPDGQVGAPSITFDQDTDTGFYRSGSGAVSFASNGIAAVTLSSASFIAPSFIPTSSTVPTNGVYLPAANSVAISTNSTARLYVNSLGSVGIGTTSPVGDGTALHIHGTTYSTLHLTNGTTGQASSDGFEIVTDGSTAGDVIIRNRETGNLIVQNAGNEAFRVDSSRRLLVGTSTATNDFDGNAITPQIQLEGTDGNTSALSTVRNSANNGGPSIRLGKSRSASIGGRTIIQNGDLLGEIAFEGANGTDFIQAANIQAWSDATPGVIDMPGRLVFSTTADGASSPTERMRIGADGILYLGATGTVSTIAIARLQVVGTAAATFQGTGGAGAQVAYFHNTATTGNNLFVEFGTEASITTRGTVDYNRAAGQVRYNVTSDRRLKSDIQPASTALGALSAIHVRSYKWVETGYQVDYGFIAQELNEVAPDAVKVGDDGEEVTDTWAVDNGKLVPLLTKALQEAIAKIETLESEVAALKAQ